MKQMKNTKMAIVFAVALTVSLAWGINEEAQAAKSCENPRCKVAEDLCVPGNSWSLRPSCKDDYGNIKCELALTCSFPLPDPE